MMIMMMMMMIIMIIITIIELTYGHEPCVDEAIIVIIIVIIRTITTIPAAMSRASMRTSEAFVRHCAPT
jgi:hypothetical protein